MLAGKNNRERKNGVTAHFSLYINNCIKLIQYLWLNCDLAGISVAS